MVDSAVSHRLQFWLGFQAQMLHFERERFWPLKRGFDTLLMLFLNLFFETLVNLGRVSSNPSHALSDYFIWALILILEAWVRTLAMHFLKFQLNIRLTLGACVQYLVHAFSDFCLNSHLTWLAWVRIWLGVCCWFHFKFHFPLFHIIPFISFHFEKSLKMVEIFNLIQVFFHMFV